MATLLIKNPTNNIDTLVDFGNNSLYLKDVVDTLNNSPDGTDDKFDEIISKTALVVSTADLMGNFSSKSYNNPTLSGTQAFSKAFLMEINVALVGASSINAIKHTKAGNYDKAISNGLVALSGSVGVLSQTLSQEAQKSVVGKRLEKLGVGLDVIAFGLSVAAQVAAKGGDIADAIYNGYQKATKTINGIQEQISQYTKEVQAKVNQAKQAVKDAEAYAKEVAAQTKNDAHEKVQKAKEELAKAKAKAQEVAKEVAKRAEEFAKEVSKNIKETLKDISDKLADAYDKAVEQASNIIKDLEDKAHDAWEAVKDNIADLSDYIANLHPAWAALNRLGKHFFYDPLVLDLDGDGIETVGHNKKNGAMFDFTGAQVKVATGWLKADDGILVYDRNNDGIINDGRELFGDATQLKDGSIAKHGFVALADLDNNSDNKIDKNDTAFGKLKVWRDLNQDGISQIAELFNFDELNIQHLNLSYQDTNQNLAGGNKLTQIGSYQKEDGTTLMMGDVTFMANNIYSTHLNTSSTASLGRLATVDMIGAGRVGNLAQAMTKSKELKELVEQYIKADKQGKQAMLFDVIKAWAKTDPAYQEYQSGLLQSVESSDNTGVGVSASQKSSILNNPNSALMQQFAKAKSKIGIIDSFLDTKTTRLYYVTEQDIKSTINTIDIIYDKIAASVYTGLSYFAYEAGYADEIDVVLDMSGDTITSYYSLDTLAKSYESKFAQGGDVAGHAFVNAIELLNYAIKKGNIKTDSMAKLVDDFINSQNASELKVWLDKIDKSMINNKKIVIGTDGADGLTGSVLFGQAGDDYLQGVANADVLYGGEGNDRLYAGQGNDILHGNQGDDYLDGSHDDDVLYGDEGNDHLLGGYGNDTLVGGSGNDRLYDSGKDNGADTYVFEGDYGQDIISDYDWNTSSNRHIDTARFVDVNTDEIKFELTSHNLIIHTNDKNSVTIENAVVNQSYHIEQFEFRNKTLSYDELIGLKAANYTGTSNADMLSFERYQGDVIAHIGAGSDTVYSGIGKDVIYGESGDDRLYGGAGQDKLYGGLGNDSLDGGQEDDVLYGDEGNDNLTGGNGNDTLVGGAGNDRLYDSGKDNGADTYVFEGSYGRDLVHDYDNNISDSHHIDTLWFKDVKADDVKLEITSRSLVIHTSDHDSVTVEHALMGQVYHIEQFVFSDKTMTLSQLLESNMAYYYGTSQRDADSSLARYTNHITATLGAGNDTFYAGSGNDVLHGDEGDDYLNGGAGDDVLVGGTGVDVLAGGKGADRFVFDVVDDAIDRINDFNLGEGDTLDISKLLEGVGGNQDNWKHLVRFEKSHNTIRLSVDADITNNTFDKKIIAELYTQNTNHTLEQLNQGMGVVL